MVCQTGYFPEMFLNFADAMLYFMPVVNVYMAVVCVSIFGAFVGADNLFEKVLYALSRRKHCRNHRYSEEL